MSEETKISSILTTFHEGETDNGRIEFYEYSRSLYAQARLIATIESFRRYGVVPKRISGKNNVEMFTYMPEEGSWKYLTNLFKSLKLDPKLKISFDRIFSRATGDALDSMDIFNSNTNAIVKKQYDIDVEEVVKEASSISRKNVKTIPKTDTESGVKQLSDEAIKKAIDFHKDEKIKRVSLETELSIAKMSRQYKEQNSYTALDDSKGHVERVLELSNSQRMFMYDEEVKLLNAMGEALEATPANDDEAAIVAARLKYAANDMECRLNRRIIGDRFSVADIGATEENVDELVSRVRPLMRDIVLPLRRSPKAMDLSVGKEKKKIIFIDEIRGRMISDSALTRDIYEIQVFVIEYNRVLHTGRCRINDLDVEVPFSLNRSFARTLNDAAADGLKEDERTFIARAYVDDSGRIRSLLVENIK